MSIRTHLNTLESAGLVRVAQLEPDLEYLFRHALVQEAVYTSLLSNDRKRLHKSVGESMEQIYADRLEDLAAVLARHFKEAGEDDRAYRYFILAGDAALESYANREAEIQYRNALSLACGVAERAALLNGLGEALYRQGQYDECMQAWGEGIEIFRSLAELDEVARLYARSARAAWYGGGTTEGLRVAQEGLRIMGDAPESPAVAMLIHEAARAYHFNGLPDQALRLCERALEMAERLGAIDVQADALTTLGVLPNRTPEQAIEALSKAVELSESAGLLQIANRAHHNLGVMYNGVVGDHQAAQEHYRRATEIAQERGVISEEVYSLINYAAISFNLGQMAEAEQLVQRAGRLTAQIPDPDLVEIQVEVMRGVLDWFYGDAEQALESLRNLLDQVRASGDLQYLLTLCTELAWFILERSTWEGQVGWEEAEALLLEAIPVADRGLGDRVRPRAQLSLIKSRRGDLEGARQWLDEAEAAQSGQMSIWDDLSLTEARLGFAEAEGRWGEALGLAESLAAQHHKFGHQIHWARSLLEWAQIHARRGEPTDLERARALLREAGRAYEQIGARYYLNVIDRLSEDLRARIYAQAQDHLKVNREMADAGRVQESLLPGRLPVLPGWGVTAALEAAGQTSGDFYDFISLPGDRLGLVIADVADKGAGAALFMALTRSLLRTYAAQYVDQPEQAMAATNQRILADSQAGLFVTVFYAVLDSASGVLSYCNAGHNPPYLLKAAGSEGIRSLGRTGVPLGIFEDAIWESQRLELQPGDMLALYTDGVTEAKSQGEDFYGEERLQAVLLAQRGKPVEQIQKAVLEDVHAFVGNAPRFDDLTLVVLSRDPSGDADQTG